jgi:hypothetical protein
LSATPGCGALRSRLGGLFAASHGRCPFSWMTVGSFFFRIVPFFCRVKRWLLNANKGLDKLRQVSEHVNLVMRYIPYVQTNFVLGMDLDEGAEPFELTKKFIDLTPGAFPAYSLLTAF